MKRFILFIVLFLTITTAFAEDKWYPFVIPAKLDPDSPANIGKLVLDSPAGKHGFVKVKDGNFYFEDGARAKFWGTNLVFNACFPTHKQAEMLADRIAFFGFNAVRLHHMDYYFEPKGIFEDICPAFKNPQMKKTTKLSPRQLDKLDYLIYQLKLRGVYININLLVARHFTEADGVIGADKLGAAAKPLSMFDPTLIELQKKYAKDLLTHYNPYTKLHYRDDPAISLLEITNENSLYHNWQTNRLDNISEKLGYYSQELDKKWNEWLKSKYETPENVMSAWQNKGSERLDNFNFKRIVHKQKYLYSKQAMLDAAFFYKEIEGNFFTEMIRFLKVDLGIKIPITGSQYSTLEVQESCDFIDKHSYWDHPVFPHKSYDKNDFKIHNKSALSDKELGIIGNILEKQKGLSFTKDNQLNKFKPFTITEWNHCYPNEYAYETPLLIAAEAIKNDWDGLFQFAFSHGWKIEPILDDIDNYFNAMPNSQQSILLSLGSLVFNNANTSFEAKDGILIVKSDTFEGISGAIKNKSIQLNHFILTADTDGLVFVYSEQGELLSKAKKLTLVAISEVKNANSGWKNGKFNWGNAPTLLKKISVKSSSLHNRKYETVSSRSNSPWSELIFQDQPK